MTVKDAKKRIEDLTGIYDNLIKIQECCLRNENAKEHIEKIEEESGINTSLRSLASGAAGYINDEIQRIEKIIDNAVVKLD